MLPIFDIKDNFLSTLAKENLIILTAPPGAGKSTALPLWLLNDASTGKIYLLQPRRMAAKSIACYLAQQIGEQVGQSVGYRLRNDVRVSEQTKLEVITEGILTQIMQSDPELSGCSVILFDEFHERSVHADMAFAIARDIQLGFRDDLKLVLMSATLDNQQLTTQLPEAVSLSSKGRSYEVAISYQPNTKQQSWRDHLLEVIKQAFNQQSSILVFLPGSGDIRYLEEKLAPILPQHFNLAPLYGELSLAQQQQAIAPPEQGVKLVLATNIAETSLTIEGINLVIDSGLEKVAVYDSQSLTNKLVMRETSKASAIQRAGRAGRLAAGQCIRTYSKENYDRRLANASVDILQTDLQPCLIEAARWGVAKLEQLPMLTLPQDNQEQYCWQNLIQLNMVDDKHRLTEHGNLVSRLATHPRFGHMILTAKMIEHRYQEHGLAYLACLLAALLEQRDIFSPQQRQASIDITERVAYLKHAKSGKHSLIIKQAQQLANQAQIKQQQILPTQHCGHLLFFAYPERIAKAKSHGVFLAANGKQLILDETDSLASSAFICAAHLVSYQHQLTAVLASGIDICQLEQWQQVQYQHKRSLNYDDNRQQITLKECKKLGAIIISEATKNDAIDQHELITMWCDYVRRKGLGCLKFSPATEQLVKRWAWVTHYQPHLAFPHIDEVSLLEDLEQWFAPYINGTTKLAAIQQLDHGAMLLARLDFQQQQCLQQVAPSHYVAPTGQRVAIEYDEQPSPKIALPLQAVYGERATPFIGDIQSGKQVSLTLVLLSPAKRPVQVTQNLAEFWQGSYQEVKKEMRGRYPKHYWPDEPLNAQPTNKTKRFL